VDVSVLLSQKRSVSALVLIVVVIGLPIITSGCIGTTQAASRLQQGGKDGASALPGNPVVPVVRLAAQGSTILHFDPSPAQVTVGSVGAVQLRLENVDNLYGIEVHLTFAKNILQIEDDDPGRGGVQITTGEIPYPDFTVLNIVDNLGGRLDYAVVQLAPRLPASGSGVVATIRFRGVNPGTSAINFTHVKLASPDGFAIPVTLQSGTVIVSETVPPTATSPPTTAAPTDTPGPTATPSPPTAVPSITPTPVPAPVCPALYVVRSGDTAFSISRRFGVSLDALAAANNLPASFNLKIGQLLVIPGLSRPSVATHVVQGGDTLYSIARRYGTSVETLDAINHIPYPWYVQARQTLLICPQ